MKRFLMAAIVLALCIPLALPVHASDPDLEYQEYGGISTFAEIYIDEYPDFYFLLQPSNVQGELNASVSMSVLVNLSDVTYQWQYRSSPSRAWANTTASGNKTDTIQLTVADVRNGYQYRCLVTDSSGRTIASSFASLHVASDASSSLAYSFSIISQCLGFAISTFTSLLNGSGLVNIYLGAVFILLVAKFLLLPIFGSSRFSGSSDSVKNSKNK